MIHETVVTTSSAAGDAHVAPMGIRYDGDRVVLMPFKPSRTYDNVLARGCAVVNFTVDTRIFAGCVSGRRRDWPCVPADEVSCVRLAESLGHLELALSDHVDDATRPVLRMRRVRERVHSGFGGFNRAQAAVIEGAVLVSRLHMLPRSKIESEFAYLQIAIDKTAGPVEREAWSWLQEAVAAHYAAPSSATPGTG